MHHMHRCHAPPMHWCHASTHAPMPCTTHARPSLPIDPRPNPAPPNQYPSALHDTAAQYLYISKKNPISPQKMLCRPQSDSPLNKIDSLMWAPTCQLDLNLSMIIFSKWTCSITFCLMVHLRFNCHSDWLTGHRCLLAWSTLVQEFKAL